MRRLALVGLVIATVLIGQKKQRDQEVGSNPKLITLNVSAVDASGERPGDLTEADFQVFEDGKQQKITSFVKNDGKQKAAVKLGPHEFSNHASPRSLTPR
jgi:hypothetical protein